MDTTELRTRVGMRVKQLREAAGLSQAAFGKRAGLTQRAVSGLERGLYSPSLDTLAKVMRGLNATAGELIDGADGVAETSEALSAIHAHLRNLTAQDLWRGAFLI